MSKVDSSNISEATFESNVKAIISKYLPWIAAGDITLQDVFSIPLGHSVLEVHGKKGKSLNKKTIRSDILIRIYGKPIAIFELKAPKIDIDEDDITQGITYARNTQPITPIVIISNSSDTRILDSISGNPLDTSGLSDATSFASMISYLLASAGKNTQNALDCFNGGATPVINAAFWTISKITLARLTGTIKELDKAICNEFSVKRSVSDEICQHIQNESDPNFVVISGKAQVGKTCVARELATKLNNASKAVLYIDSLGCSRVYEEIERILNRQFGLTFDSKDVQRWMRSYIRRADICVIIDGIQSDQFSEIKPDIISLSRDFEGSSSSIVLVTSQVTAEMEFKQAGRKMKSELSDKVRLFEVEDLSESEFRVAIELMENSMVSLDRNHIGTPEFRSLRVLRTLLNVLPEYPMKEGTLFPQGVLSDVFEIVSDNEQLSEELVSLLGKMGVAFAKYYSHTDNPALALYSFEKGCLPLTALLNDIPRESIDLLRCTGLVEIAKWDESTELVIPRDPISFSCASLKSIISDIQRIHGIKEKYERFLSLCNCFPSGDLLAVHTLKIIYRIDSKLFEEFFNFLVSDTPRQEFMGGKVFDALVKIENTVHPIHCDFSKVSDEVVNEHVGHMVINHNQWVVLSLTLSSNWFLHCIAPQDYFSLVYMIASYKQVLFRSYTTDIIDDGHATHDIPNTQYEFLCSSHLQVEPIQMAIERLYFVYPKAIDALILHGSKNNNFPLVNRLRIFIDSINPILLKTQRELIYEAWKHCMKLITNPNTGRNEPCHCQSGKKVKKCCGIRA